jgi:cyclophilin family peptidyl-prolyl cis-trans isomerase
VGTDKRERQKEGRRARLEAAAAAQQQQIRKRRFITLAVAVVVIGALVGAYLLLSDDDGDSVATDTTATSTPTTTASDAVPPPPGPGETITGETPCPATDGSSPRTTSFEQAPPMCLEEGKQYTATFTTNLGDIKVQLDTENTPATANNFAVLANYHYYDDTAIFRTDPSIEIIQGGSPTTNAADDPGPGYTIEDEGSDFTYQEGQLVMARKPTPNSAGAQFFFVAGPAASSLDADGTYVVFGNVTEGLDLVKQILASHEADPANPLGGAPAEPVVIEQVTIEETAPA